MYVYVCFDVEDLVHPDSDDIVLDIAEMLADDGIVASMCVVGEKARLWERRGRTDVIAAVGKHDVSLHTDHHSVHPNVSEYLADKGWADGVEEAVRQEGPGVRDLARIFGVYPSTWGTGGWSWGPQIPAATRELGLPSHIYSISNVGQTAANWFTGQLCFFDFLEFPGDEDAYCNDADFEVALATLLEQIRDAQRRGLACLGLFAAHPTRLRYTVFWDALNFVAGQSTDPSKYRFAPRRDDEAYAAGLRNLRRMILSARELPGVELISTRALNGRFAYDTGPIDWQDLRRLAQATADKRTIQAEEPLASPAQTLDGLARAMLRLADGGAAPTHLLLRRVLGPVGPAPGLDRVVTTDAKQGLALCRELVGHVDKIGHLPTKLLVDGMPVGPGPLLRGMASAFLEMDRSKTSKGLTLQSGSEEPAIAGALVDELGKHFHNWPPHPPDLSLDRLALHTQLQSWSLKPAVLAR